MGSMSINLVEGTLCDVFTTRYYATSNTTRNSSFSFVMSEVTELTYRGPLDETLYQSFNSCSRMNTFTQALMEQIVNDPDFIAPVAAFIK